ncbi:MAG: glycosyltransferase [Gemmatimonas sp.]|nr:glycosyltransferase [Gemmatimonas sp.]
MKVAIVADWVATFGGGERVLMELHSLFPEAPIFTSVWNEDVLPPEMHGWDVRTSFLQRIPFAKRRYQLFLPLMPMAFEQFDLRGFDLVITTNHACAKGVITPANTVNLCYCYTPCRYLWDLYHDYTDGLRSQPLIAPVAHWLRLWDRLAADRVDHFVAISQEVARRVWKHYRRDSEVIYPPVDVQRFRPSGEPSEDFYLVVSRLVPYKRIDLAVEACTRLGRRLIVAGHGPERRRLEALAGPTVEFVGRQSDEELASLYSRCRALLFPGLEDFGIAPVEAQAAGRPVIAYGKGGATETIVEGVTGMFFEEQAADSLAEAIQRHHSLRSDPRTCRKNAERFDRVEFRHRLARTIAELTEAGQGPRAALRAVVDGSTSPG